MNAINTLLHINQENFLSLAINKKRVIEIFNYPFYVFLYKD